MPYSHEIWKIVLHLRKGVLLQPIWVFAIKKSYLLGVPLLACTVQSEIIVGEPLSICHRTARAVFCTSRRYYRTSFAMHASCTWSPWRHMQHLYTAGLHHCERGDVTAWACARGVSNARHTSRSRIRGHGYSAGAVCMQSMTGKANPGDIMQFLHTSNQHNTAKKAILQ